MRTRSAEVVPSRVRAFPVPSSIWGVLAAIIVALFAAQLARAQWTVTNLHPAGDWAASSAFGAWGTQQVGSVDVGGATSFDPPYYASLWSGTAASWVNLNPNLTPDDVAYASAALGISGNQQVGHIRIPFGPGPGGRTRRAAALWSGTAASWVDLNPPHVNESEAYGISATQQVGWAGGGACLWGGTAASWVDLHPAGTTFSVANATSGTQQAGYAEIGGVRHASRWSGTSASWVDLHPAGATASFASGISGAQQVGYATVGGVRHASLWSGTPASWIDLNPAGALSSEVSGVFGTLQAGHAIFGGVAHAGLWSGTAASWIDLSASVPAGFGSTYATSVFVDGGSTYVVGYGGYSPLGGGGAALLWTIPAPGAAFTMGLAWLGAARRSRRNPA